MTERNTEHLPCSDCSSTFTRRSKFGPTPKLCKPCSAERARQHTAKYRKRTHGERPATFVCADCEQTFPVLHNRRIPERCRPCDKERRRLRSKRPNTGRRSGHVVRQRRERKQRIEQEGRWSTCVECEAHITCNMFGPLRTRCDDCTKERATARARQRNKPAPPVPTVCPDCGGLVPRAVRTSHLARCKPCVKEHRKRLTVLWIQNNHERHRETVREAVRRRRARKRGADCEQFKAIEVFHRDRWICGICHKRIDRKLKYPHPMSASLDHIVPLSEGGAHSRANTRASHWLCNSLRRDRGGGEQLVLIG